MKDEKATGTPVARFAEELRAWRLVRGWTQAELGAEMGYSGSHVSSVETMERMPTADFARASDKACGTPQTFERLHADISRAAHRPWFSPYVQFEETADRIHCWDNRSITGLLQSEDYARELIRAGNPGMSDQDVERDVAARMQRQEIMHREHRPPYSWFVVHESALRTVFGEKSVMRGQMDALLEAGKSPHMVIQVFPSSVPGCPGVAGAVTIFDFADEPSVGYAEGYHAGRTIEASDEMAKLRLMFDHLRALALSPEDSVRMIAAIRGEYDERLST